MSWVVPRTRTPRMDAPSFLGSFEPSFWIRNLLWPSVTLALVSVASTALVMRTSLLEVIRADYMKTARAKGLPPSKVIGPPEVPPGPGPLPPASVVALATLEGGETLPAASTATTV